MPFWKKTFLILLVLFETCIVLAITVLTLFIHGREMDKTTDNAINEAHFISSSISKDIYNVSQYGNLTQSIIESIFNSYEVYYQEEGVTLEMYCNSVSRYGDTPEYDGKENELILSGDNKTVIKKIGNHREIFISIPLLSPYDNYDIIYATSLKEFDDSWTSIINVSIIIGGAVTLFLTAILVLVLHNLTRPLRELQRATQEIAEGSYNSRVSIKGKDEFAQLAGYYNSMAENIENKINELNDNNTQKQLLIDNMAHEIRTPLMSISGYAEYMQRAKLNEDQIFESLDYIVNESNRLSKMSRTLLTLAGLRVDELQKDSIEITELFSQLRIMLYQKLHEKNVVLELNNTVDKLTGNFELVESLFINLIENAIRACTDNGHITVNIDAWDDEEAARITIEDNGIGMEESEITKIQEPFYRVDKDRSRKNGGVGLGVTLCSKIIEVHNATLRYESEPGVGTRAIIKW